MKKISPFYLDRYGSRAERMDDLNKPEGLLSLSVCDLVVMFFMLVDFVCLKVVWNIVMTENPFFVICVAAACAVVLDLPMSIAAKVLKKYNQGLCDKKEKNQTIILAIAAFTIAFVFSFCFRIFTKDVSFSPGTEETLTNTLTVTAQTDTSDPSILVAALFNGVLPLLTSLASFIVSYYMCDPLKIKLGKLEKGRIGLQANIHQAEKALAETASSEQYCNELIAREGDLYQEFMDQLDADALALKQMVRVLIMRKLGTPEYVSAMSKAGAKLTQTYEIDGGPGQKLPEFIGGQMYDGEKKEEVIMSFTDHAA